MIRYLLTNVSAMYKTAIFLSGLNPAPDAMLCQEHWPATHPDQPEVYRWENSENRLYFLEISNLDPASIRIISAFEKNSCENASWISYPFQEEDVLEIKEEFIAQWKEKRIQYYNEIKDADNLIDPQLGPNLGRITPGRISICQDCLGNIHASIRNKGLVATLVINSTGKCSSFTVKHIAISKEPSEETPWDFEIEERSEIDGKELTIENYSQLNAVKNALLFMVKNHLKEKQMRELEKINGEKKSCCL